MYHSLTYSFVTAFVAPIIVASRNISQYSNVFCHKMKNPFQLKLCRNTRVHDQLL